MTRNIAEKNGQWKDKPGMSALHGWIKNRLEKPKYCQSCGKKKKLDLANISQEYKRDLSDWEWLCRKCHMRKDGRANRLRFTKNHTRATRQKLSIALKGKPKSEEWKNKMRGRKHSTEYIQFMKEKAKTRKRNEKGMFI